MPPKFEVGELVILQSESRPDLNGEHEVIAIVSSGDFYQGFIVGENMPGTFGYDLGIPDEIEGGNHVFGEPSLRKKHLPGSLSFRDLMQTLKDPSHA